MVVIGKEVRSHDEGHPNVDDSRTWSFSLSLYLCVSFPGWMEVDRVENDHVHALKVHDMARSDAVLEHDTDWCF
jgi:hypothetical protein